MGSKDGKCTTIDFEDDEALVDNQYSTFQPIRKARTKVSLGKIKRHEPVELPFCGTCIYDEHDKERCTDNE